MQSNTILTRPSVYLFFCILLIVRSSWAQQQFESSRNLAKSVITPSPAAAGIGTFGNTPVSRYTGTPDINVPLYEVNYKDLSIALSLKYHQAIGTKPDAFPGSNGNGWVLNSGGVITRISRGATAINMPAGYPLPVNFNPTAATDWSSQAKMDDHLSKQTVFINPEGRYDEYAYNFAGYSGKFYMDHTDVFRIRTEQGEDILVEKVVKSDTNFVLPQEAQMPGVNCIVFPYTDTLVQRYIVYKFTLTDSKGIKYSFGGNNESIEITRPGMEYGVADLKNENPIPTSWYLTSIESPNGYKIDLKYTRGKFYITNEISVFGRNIVQDQWRDAAIDVPHPPYIKSTMYHPCYLDEIVTPINKVKFNWSIANQQLGYNFTVDCLNNNISGAVHFYFYPNVKNASISGRFPSKLDNFIVSDVLGIRRKKIDFSYTNSTTTRLKLLSVKLRGDSDTPSNVPTYTFEYNPTALPAYLALKNDDYGFFNNNNTYTSSTDPQYYYNLFTNTTSRQNYQASRAPNATYAVAEVLQKVTYPTGGYTEYEFELNQYGRVAKFWPATLVENPTGANINTGGLRIKRITHFDATNHKATEKQFFYRKSYSTGGTVSSGVLSFEPVHYDWFSGTIAAPKFYQGKPGEPNFVGTLNYLQYSTEPLNQANYRGNHITYSEVAELDLDGSYTVSKYKNYDNNYHDRPAERMVLDNSNVGELWKEDEMNSMELERGQLMSEERYSNTNSLRQSSVYQYNDDVNRFNTNVRRIKLSPNAIFSSNYPSIRYTATLVYTYYPFLKTITTTNYETGGSISSPITRTYHAANRLLTSETSTDSKAQAVVVSYKYPHDYADAVSIAMTSKHIISPLIETKTTVAGTQVNLVQTPHYSPSANIYVPQEIKVQNGAGPLETRLQFTKYDSRGSLLEQQKPGDIKENFVWSKSHYLLAKISGSDYATVISVGSQSLYDDPLNNESTIPGALQGMRNSIYASNAAAQVTTYSYQNSWHAGPSLIVDPAAKPLYYQYDSFGRLKSVSDLNVAATIRASYCYNYRGQPTDCASMAPTGSIAATALALVAEGALPVTLINFEVLKAEKSANLTWSTSFETNSDKFEIERSTDAKSWVKIGTVAALGESNATRRYDFTDTNPVLGGASHGENFYRLKMIDADATFTYSRIRSVIFTGGGETALYPNPITIGATLTILANDPSSIALIKIFDSTGKLVHHTKVTKQINTNHLPAGLYVVMISYTDGSTSSHRIVKQ